MDIARISLLQQQFNDTTAQHDEEDAQRNRLRRQGNSVGEKQSLDRLKQLGNLSIDIQRQIGELMCQVTHA